MNPTLSVITLNVNRLKFQPKIPVFLELWEKIQPLLERLQEKQCPQRTSRFSVKEKDEENHGEFQKLQKCGEKKIGSRIARALWGLEGGK